SLVTLEMPQRSKNESALDLVEGCADRHLDQVGPGTFALVRRAQRGQVLFAQAELAIAEDVRALNGVAQLAHVAGPAMLHEARAQILGQALARAASLARQRARVAQRRRARV